ncbi:phospholipase D family protein [Serpentinicella sp. ANB-PHB4]|uniref:phospholipase D-like domain-containing protein n=1 Tax=Serpentinicella sp. ANB-PHB4 TaxID=3074076 RepID=UPI00285CA0CF|nr:phospholipase D family protein [Serpentinicella sp. ANB-PHB4]MDR5659083.1 phospholipase D family protein [Serpentinicella sp. ANB-PHB4]
MKFKNIIKKIGIVYAIYLIVFGVIVFAFHSNYTDKPDVQQYLSEEEGPDRVVLLEDRYASAIGRINLIENAEKSVDIAYYTLHKGIMSDVFYGKLLEAADRGVQIRFLVDGMFHNMRGKNRSAKYALLDHPNIDLKFYEPISFIKPWTLNNRLHDKYMIVDNQYAMIGGRNIGDKYFLEDYNGEFVHDRDVLIVNTDRIDVGYSVVEDMKQYFNNLWNHEFTSEHKELRNRQIKKATEKRYGLRIKLLETEEKYPEMFKSDLDWLKKSIPTNKVTLVYNPVTRFNKKPNILLTISELLEYATNTFVIQSPYVIPTNHMLKYIDVESISSKDVIVITNSIAASPNYFAMGGYKNKRKDIVDITSKVYEYHGPGSIHGKSYIIDDRLSVVGSFNLDARSSFLSTESMVIIDSEAFTTELFKEMDSIVGKSLKVNDNYDYAESDTVIEKKSSLIKRVIIAISSIFSYIFDFLL